MNRLDEIKNAIQSLVEEANKIKTEGDAKLREIDFKIVKLQGALEERLKIDMNEEVMPVENTEVPTEEVKTEEVVETPVEA